MRTEATRKELNIAIAAHLFACNLVSKGPGWFAYVPLLGLRRWNGWLQVNRICEYLYSRYRVAFVAHYGFFPASTTKGTDA